jgi:hypothetical protein
VHEPRAVHRLHHTPGRLAISGDATRQPIQTIAVHRHRVLIDQLAVAREQADINPLATQIKTCMQHRYVLLPRPSACRQDQPIRPRTVTGGWLFVSDGRPRGHYRARLTNAVRDGGPTSCRRLPPGAARPPSWLFQGGRRPALARLQRAPAPPSSGKQGPPDGSFSALGDRRGCESRVWRISGAGNEAVGALLL